MIRFTSMFFNLNFWGRQYIVVVSPAFTRNVTHPYMVVNFAFSTWWYILEVFYMLQREPPLFFTCSVVYCMEIW